MTRASKRVNRFSLFTISYAQLVWWQALLGLLVWPSFLGVAVR